MVPVTRCDRWGWVQADGSISATPDTHQGDGPRLGQCKTEAEWLKDGKYPLCTRHAQASVSPAQLPTRNVVALVNEDAR